MSCTLVDLPSLLEEVDVVCDYLYLKSVRDSSWYLYPVFTPQKYHQVILAPRSIVTGAPC